MLATGETQHHRERDPKHLWVIGYVNWVFRFRWLVLLITLVVVGAGAYGMLFLEEDPDTRLFFSPSSPERLTLTAMEDTYGAETNVIILIDPKEADVFNESTLRLVAAVTDAAWSIPDATRVDSLTNYKYSYSQDDTFIVEDLVPEAAGLSASELAEIKRRAFAEPALVNQLISSAGDITAVSISIVRPQDYKEAVPRIANAAQRLVDDLKRQYPDVGFHLTGAIMADWAFAQAADQDMRRLVPLMVILVVVSLWAGLRSPYSVVATVAVVLMSVGVASGYAGWQGLTLNSVTSGAPIMSMTLAIADCVHLLAGAGQLQRRGLPHAEAIAESMRLNWVAVLLTSVTTALSFLALNFADSPPLRDVGNIVAVGVTAAWILSITSFLAILAVLPAPKQLPTLSDPRLLDQLSELIIRRRTAILAGSTVLVVLVGIGSWRLQLNDDFIKYFSDEFQFRRDTEFLQNRLTGLHTLEYSIPSGEESGVSNPVYLAKLDGFAAWLRAQDKVTHVSVVTDIMKRLNRNMHNDDPQYYRLPESRELAAQYLLLYEMSLPEGYSLNNQIDIDKSTSMVSANLANVTSGEIKTIGLAGEAWLARAGLRAPPSGLSIMYAYLSENNIRSMVGGTIAELVVISFLMIFMLRSVRVGLISLIPNLVPAILAFGLWGWIGSQVNLAISVVAAMTFGIVVDDTIHSLIKYMRARRQLGMGPVDAVRYTFISAGAPMLLIGFTLMLGFGVLALSGFAVSHQMGVLSAMIIGLAVVADLVLLPPLLILFDRADRSARRDVS